MALHFEASVTAKCKPGHVWQKFEALPQWGWWNSIVGQTRWLEGKPWQKGSRFLMELVRPKHLKMKPVVLEADPPNKVGWVGTIPGFRGEHWFSFEAQGDGTTLIKTWEDASGWATMFFGSGLKQKLQSMHEEWLQNLKAEAEKIAREESARQPAPASSLPVIHQPKAL